jgi:hypothetical protein
MCPAILSQALPKLAGLLPTSIAGMEMLPRIPLSGHSSDDGIMGDSGCTMAQIYAGKRGSKLVAHGMTSETQPPNLRTSSVNTVLPIASLLRQCQSPNWCSRTCILRLYKIKDFQCEPEHQHQNFAEREIDVKTPFHYHGPYRYSCCFLASSSLRWVLLNHMSLRPSAALLPSEAATVRQISPLLQFHWWEPVSIKPDAVYPSQIVSKGSLGWR